MISFAEMLRVYGAENNGSSLFGEILLNTPEVSRQAPLNRDEALVSMKEGDEWHNNMIRLCASYVSKGLSKEEVLRLFAGVTIEGYTYEETQSEISVAYDGARSKGFHLSSASLGVRGPKTEIERPLLQWLHEIELEQPVYLLHKMIELGSLSMVFGKPGSGKSFVAVDIAASVASGRSFHGVKTQQKDVIFIAAEAFAGIVRRFNAWSKHHEVAPSDIRVMIANSAVNYSDKNAVLKLREELIRAKQTGLKPGLIVVDTLAASYGSDENSNSEMSIFINTLKQFNLDFECATLLIHHAGHGDSNRARGASSLNAALDSEFSCNKQQGTVFLQSTKAKDIEKPDDLSFILEVVELGLTNDGEPVTSAVLTRDDTVKIKTKITASAKRHLATFIEAAKESNGEVWLGDVLLERRVKLEKWREVFYRRATQDNTEAKRKSFERARKLLVDRGLLEVDDDMYITRFHDAGQTRQNTDM